ncbi:MAG: ABC transporter ATP-binding protein [Chromatiales bacterium]|nr:ABC transporter ATP-binding protein [Chromatiales bacterium]
MSLLQGNGISLALDGRAILDQVDITLQPGEMLGLIGPNGAGKSTLLKILIGLLSASAGEVRLDNQPLNSIPPNQRGRQIAYLAQEAAAHWPIQVERLVQLGRTPHLSSWQRLSGTDQQIVEQAMINTDVNSLRDRVFTTLSGGERMRVLLARALAVEPTILLADEPVAALDPAHQLEVMALFANHCQAGGSTIVVLHDLSLAAHFCDRLILLNKGQKVADDTPEAVLSEENLRQVYNIALRTPEDSGSPLHLPWIRVDQ